MTDPRDRSLADPSNADAGPMRVHLGHGGEVNRWNEHPAAGPELDGLLAEADIVSLHVPLTDTTRHLIGSEAISHMKPDAILVNAARGGVVDEAAVSEALKAGRLGGAALDVFETEPLTAEAAAKFAGVPNLVLTPHIAGVTGESNVRVSTLIAETVLNHLS